MIRALAYALALCAPVQALALSCVAPSVTRSFHAADAAPETYVVVKGRLDFAPADLEAAARARAPRAEIAAQLRGRALSMGGFVHPFDQPVTLELLCFGPWCGQLQSGVETLVFLRREGGRHLLTLDPCGGFAFARPTAAQLNRIQRCFRGEDCPID